ncbi:MAG: serine/threonine-protein kinase [Myxococcota bacterium]
MGVDRDSTAGGRQPGDILFDRYRVEAKIADGGMSTVYRCLDLHTRNKVALKVLYEVYNDKPVIRTRFIDEGRIQQMLTHPNIVDVYDVQESPDLLGIVMELVAGPTLEDHLEARGTLSTDTILRHGLPVLSAIGFAHSKGVIHRDIKPSNILLKPTSRGMVPRVMDFGVAKLVRGKDLTATGTTVGTLHYMSPEQIVGSKDIDGRADIYSLGCTLYKLCTGDVPFNAATEFALMMAQVEAPPTPPSELNPDVSPALEKVILRCLAKRPDDRYPSVKDLTLAMLELRSDASEGDTDTIPISQDLLDYAMNADEVAIDRTGIIDVAALTEAGGGDPTQKELRRVELDDEDEDPLSSPTREMTFDPSIDMKETKGQDPTLEASLDSLSTVPLSTLGDQSRDSEPRAQDRTVEQTHPLRSVDRDIEQQRGGTRDTDSADTTEFEPNKNWVEGSPPVDSREQTQPRAEGLKSRSHTPGDDDETVDERLEDQTTEEKPARVSSTGGHVQMFESPDLDAADSEEERTDEASEASLADRLVLAALVLVLLALLGVGAVVLLGRL